MEFEAGASSPDATWIRPVREADLEVLYRLSQECFPSEPWTLEGLREELARDVAVCSVVEVVSEGVIAYLLAWNVLDEVHILRVATRPDQRRRGIADRLLQHLLELRHFGARVFFLEVRASNLAARALYEKHGFKTLGVRKGYYREPVEDAIVMACTEGAGG
jgi:ribosomal-protein-alanine N-acetyltransferase